MNIIRKDIKNLHLGVYPPEGHVRVAVPLHVSDERVRLAIISKLAWIKKQQADFKKQVRQSEREMVTGESHYFMGKRFLLEVIERSGRHQVEIKGNRKLLLYVKPNTSLDNRQLVLNEWYREQLKKRIPDLLSRWQEQIGVYSQDWRVKKMKTKWGSCNIAAKRIWLNLELAKKPPECLEYILVHELVHLLERHHNDRFRAHMDHFMPNWRIYRDMLNSSPLGHEAWKY
ncbi:MAG: metal-dependent hydrolase [Gammaproteobacteria bacterium]|nr:MAG: metal-dependent hydrolase [Gammaproteobacteria bacterium]